MRLLHAYLPADAEQHSLRDQFLSHLQAHANGTRRDCLPDHITASALVVDASARRVLLGLHARTGLWLQMGGHIEDGDEMIAAVALREAVEESGIEDLRLLSETQLRLDCHPAPCAPEARYHLDFQFVALAPRRTTQP